MVHRNYEPWTEVSPILHDNLVEIGIDLKVREFDISTACTTIQTMRNLVPIAINAGWGKDCRARTGSISPSRTPSSSGSTTSRNLDRTRVSPRTTA
jgi:hypothetical protein